MISISQVLTMALMHLEYSSQRGFAPDLFQTAWFLCTLYLYMYISHWVNFGIFQTSASIINTISCSNILYIYTYIYIIRICIYIYTYIYIYVYISSRILANSRRRFAFSSPSDDLQTVHFKMGGRTCRISAGGFIWRFPIHGGSPIAGWFMRENPNFLLMIWGYFRKPP